MLTKSDLKEIDHVVSKGLKEGLRDYPTKSDLDSSLKSIKSDIAAIRKDIKAITSFSDHEYLELRKRVERIEEHLGLSPALS